MKTKNLSIGLIISSIFFARFSAQKLLADIGPGYGYWVKGSSFQFQAKEISNDRSVYKASLEPFEDDRKKELNGPGGQMQILDRIPYIRSVMVLREKVYDTISQKAENQDGRIFCPFFRAGGEKKEMRIGEGASSDASFSGKPQEKQRANESSQKEYFIVGYRLTPKTNIKENDWYLGLGWKSGSSGGRKGGPGDSQDGKGAKDMGGLKDPRDSNQDSVKKEFSGPILGLVGQF